MWGVCLALPVLALGDASVLDGGETKAGWMATGPCTVTTSGAIVKVVASAPAVGEVVGAKRDLPAPADLASYAGLVVELATGETEYPQTWTVELKSAAGRATAAAAVPIGAAAAVSVFLPWGAFSSGVDKSSVTAVAVYLEFQPVAVELSVHSVRAVVAPQSSMLPVTPGLTLECIRTLARRTINFGAVVYDRGSREACMAMYASALRTIASSSADQRHQEIACRALDKTSRDVEETSWAYRRAFDRLLGEERSTYYYGDGPWLDSGACPTEQPWEAVDGAAWCSIDTPAPDWEEGDVDTLALDGGATKDGWEVVLDTVMGGSSKGSLKEENGVITFEGDLSLRGGGFASVRRTLPSVDLTEFSGVLIDVEANPDFPQGWEVSVTDTSGYRFGAAAVVPVGGPRVELFLPWESFSRASRWGRRCSSCELDRASIKEVALYLLYQEGAFRLLVHSVRAVRVPAASTHPQVQLTAECMHGLAKRTIQYGVDVWNEDYQELCAAMYKSSLRTVAAGAADAAVRALACRALAFVAGSPATAAWAYRRALDAVLNEERSPSRYPSYVRGEWLHEGSCTLADPETFFKGLNWCGVDESVTSPVNLMKEMSENVVPEEDSEENSATARIEPPPANTDPARSNGHPTQMVLLLAVTILVLLLAVAYLLFRNSRKPKVIIVTSQVAQDDVVIGREVKGPQSDCAKSKFDGSYQTESEHKTAAAA